jgi:hypothetical protein
MSSAQYGRASAKVRMQTTLTEQQSCSSFARWALLTVSAAAEHSAGMTGISAPTQAGRPSLMMLAVPLLPPGSVSGTSALLPLLLLQLAASIRNRSPPSGSIANHNLHAESTRQPHMSPSQMLKSTPC